MVKNMISMEIYNSWDELNNAIIHCRKCERLVTYRETVSKIKVKRFRNWEYWGKPLVGFGDINGRLLIVGLAPAAHGGNRTGRMFTGDSSGDWLIKALYNVGFANQPYSKSKDDGLKLYDVYITAIVRCAPPKNRPLADEINNCRIYLLHEFYFLKNIRAILVLGKIAFDNTLKTLDLLGYNIERSRVKFKHGYNFQINNYRLFISYHPSRQNTQTKRLTWDMWISIFKNIKNYLSKI